MKTKRSPYDFYPTPKQAFVSFWEADKENWNNTTTVFEPCAGDGAIIKFLKEVKPELRIAANEIDEAHADHLYHSGADKVDFYDFFGYEPNFCYDTVITNPPFSLAQEFITTILTKWRPKRTIMLLRLNFLGSQKRKEFWNKFPPSRIYVLSKRPSFTGGGTDSQEYAWFVWDNNEYKQQIKVI